MGIISFFQIRYHESMRDRHLRKAGRVEDLDSDAECYHMGCADEHNQKAIKLYKALISHTKHHSVMQIGKLERDLYSAKKAFF